MKRTQPASRRASAQEGPPQRLIDAAIEQIEEHGLGQLTVRRVAAAAGMNVAAVNYYFRSKSALVAVALEGSIRHMVADSHEFLARMPENPVGILSELLTYYLEGSLRYPRITKANLHDAFVREDYSGPFPRCFAPLIQGLSAAIRASVPGLDERRAGRRAIAALSAVWFPAFFSGLFHSLDALESAEDRARYVEEVARAALAGEGPPR